MKAIAFYLPQYHVIPENEEIYGAGFTEWHNVRSARPLFAGHYQPHVPHPLLGYYDLLDEKSLVKQHELALGNGVGAFCYYYYNLAGRRPLFRALERINQSAYLCNEFCLCWDHKSWYNNRGGDRTKPFIAQGSSPELARAMFADLRQYFANPRHIRIDGKPLFLVFAPERFADITMYADIWREEAYRAGLSGLFLAGVEAFAGLHPASVGLDCMVEFAPMWSEKNHVSGAGEKPVRIDYPATVRDMLSRETPAYHRMRCAFPSWDNTPRWKEKGITAVNIMPEVFRIMLEGMAEHTRLALPDSLQYLFINAWNEWGESCHLEPDMEYGFVFLDAVREVMAKYS